MLADVQSANVVGYQSDTTPAAPGYKFYAPNFFEVGAATEQASTLSVIPVALTGSVPDGSDSKNRIALQKLSSTGGAVSGPYFWKNYTKSSNVYGPGWCTGVGKVGQDIKIAPGEAIMVTFPDNCNNCVIQFSGQVKNGDVYAQLRKGYTFVGNATPNAINLDQIIPVAAEGYSIPDGSDTATRISFQKLSPTGGAAKGPWFWKNYTKNSSVYGPGWCTGIGKAGQSLEIGPGEGFLITCDDAVNAPGISLKIPGVDLTK